MFVRRLNIIDRVSAGDTLPAFLGNMGTYMGVPVSVLQQYMQDNLDFQDQSQGPTTHAASFAVGTNERWITCNGAAAIVVELPLASEFPGRQITLKTITAQTVASASANVVPLTGGASGTPILAAVAGRWATLVSNGANWEIMQAN